MQAAERLIAIETSSRRGSVAIAEGPTRRALAEFSADQQHAVELLPSIDRLCREAGWPPASIRQVHVSIGPGSFTGLRVAVTTARHLALALGAGVVAVPSLSVIADNARLADPPPQRVAVILDAKRRQVYAGAFEQRGDEYAAVGEPALVEPAAWLASLPRPLWVMGEGVSYHAGAIDGADVTRLDAALWLPRADAVHRLGWRLACAGRFANARDLVPLYLRRPEAEEVWEQRHGISG